MTPISASGLLETDSGKPVWNDILTDVQGSQGTLELLATTDHKRWSVAALIRITRREKDVLASCAS